jgi:choline kinase
MRALILAAGVASRLRPLTDDIPKCLLPVGNRSILERMVNNLVASGIRDIVVVTGYLADHVQTFLAGSFPDLRVTFVHNSRFEITNNIYSLWLAKNAVVDDAMLLLDSDILFDRRIVELLLNSPYTNALALRTDRPLGAEEIKVLTASDGWVREIGKEIEPSRAAGESIGIERFGRESVVRLYRLLDRMVGGEKEENLFYEAAFQRLIHEGDRIAAVDVGLLRCIEIDTPEDLEDAAREVLKIPD